MATFNYPTGAIWKEIVAVVQCVGMDAYAHEALDYRDNFNISTEQFQCEYALRHEPPFVPASWHMKALIDHEARF